MKILKIKKQKSKYKEECYYCGSKLLIEFKDITEEHGIVTIYSYHKSSLKYNCPVCGGRNFISYKNGYKYYAYSTYQQQKLLKKEDKTNG